MVQKINRLPKRHLSDNGEWHSRRIIMSATHSCDELGCTFKTEEDVDRNTENGGVAHSRLEHGRQLPMGSFGRGLAKERLVSHLCFWRFWFSTSVSLHAMCTRITEIWPVPSLHRPSTDSLVAIACPKASYPWKQWIPFMIKPSLLLITVMS
jgi:hypothetical protein